MNEHHFQSGETIVFRGVSNGKIWYAIPVYVVQDTPQQLALYWPAGTRCKNRALPSGRRLTPTDILHAPLELLDHIWTDTDVLMLISPEAAHAIYVMWEEGHRRFLCWYANLQDSACRTTVGFDSMDHMLDVVFSPDHAGWRWKDEDELVEAVRLGMYSTDQADQFRAEGQRVIACYEQNRSPFCDGWEHWSPPVEWGIPVLPAGWDIV